MKTKRISEKREWRKRRRENKCKRRRELRKLQRWRRKSDRKLLMKKMRGKGS